MAEMKFDITKVVDGAIKEFKHQGYNVSKWISVDERLPEPNTMFIVACYGSDIVIPDYEHGETVWECVKRLEKECVRVTLGFIGSDGWYDSDYSPMIISPSYWQPLPEPPKDGDTNG